MFIVCLSASWLTPAGQEAREPARPCCIRVCVCFSTENISLHRCHAIFHVGSMYTCARARTCCRTLHPQGNATVRTSSHSTAADIGRRRLECVVHLKIKTASLGQRHGGAAQKTLSRCLFIQQERIARLLRRSNILIRSVARH